MGFSASMVAFPTSHRLPGLPTPGECGVSTRRCDAAGFGPVDVWELTKMGIQGISSGRYQSLWIQPYLLRKYHWGMMTRGLSTFSDSVWIHRE